MSEAAAGLGVDEHMLNMRTAQKMRKRPDPKSAEKKAKKDQVSRRCPCCKRANRQRSVQVCLYAPVGYGIQLRDEFTGRPMLVFTEADAKRNDPLVPADADDTYMYVKLRM